MLTGDDREKYDDLLSKLLDTIPGEVIGRLSTDEITLLLQGLSEIAPSTYLVPAFRDLILQYRNLPTSVFTD